ncbi:tape measure protein [Wielerella bovis]|uniref:tape measure protein n=1 Tax=Wielerella bovis TaxID=2917790 RepID=UPI0020195B55|nr:tape measure protein [Wielerella bovis]ULJ67465.1 tape measure protein [Wielerella bovis]
MATNNLDFKMRFSADTVDFKRALEEINAQLVKVNQSNKAKAGLSAEEKAAAQEAKRAAREKAEIDKVLSASLAAEAKKIERLRVQSEKNAEREAKKAAQEKMRAEREHSKTAAMLARELERERIKSERAAAAEAKKTAQIVKQTAQAAQNASPNTQMTVLAQSISSIGKSMLGWGAGIASLAAIKNSIGDILAATNELTAIRTRFEYAFGGAEQGAKQLEFVREEAKRLGLEFTGAANGYGQLAAATKELNITTEQTQDLFKGVMSATAAMGLSADEASGVFLALSQIAGKGKVSMEELRGQLGERLTPAMAIAAKSMGVTTAELEKMVENGISAEKFLPKFGAALEEAFGETAAKNVHTLNGQMNLLKNSYNEFLTSLGNGGVGQAAVTVMQDIGVALEWAQQKFHDFLQSQDGELLKQSLRQTYELIKQIGSTLGGVFQAAYQTFTDVFSTISGGERDVSLLKGALNGVSLAIAMIDDGVSGVSIAFNFFSGAAKDLLSILAQFASKMTFGKLSNDLAVMADKLHLKAQESYEKAHQQAMQFESQTSKIRKNIAETGNAAGVVYDAASESAEKATEASEKQTQALTAEQQQAEELDKAYKNAQAAATELGVDIQAASRETSKATNESLNNIQELADNFDVLQQKGVNASLLISQALSGSLKKATNEADIKAIEAKYHELGKVGKLAMEDVESGILAAKMRLQELRQETDPTEAAFKKLGVQSKEAMRLSAEEMRQAFERVKNSGKASQEELQKAFEKTANSMLQSGDAAQKEWVMANAAAHQYAVTVDKTGKAALQSAENVKKAADEQQAAHQKAGQAAQQHADAEKAVGDAAEKAAQQSDAAHQQVAENNKKRLSEYQQAVHYTLTQMKAYSQMGTAAWLPTLQSVWRLHDGIYSTVSRLNDAMANGSNLATELANAEAMAISNANKLDKTTLNGLKTAIMQARQQMQGLADDAASAVRAAEKELLQLQGKTEQIAAMEQQQKIADLQAKMQQAQKQGNTQAQQEYARAIALLEQAYQLKLQQEQEARAAAEREAREQEQAKKQAEQSRSAANIALPEPPKLDLSQVDLGNVQVDTSALNAALMQRDSQINHQLNAQLPDFVQQLVPKIMDEIARQLQAQQKSAM